MQPSGGNFRDLPRFRIQSHKHSRLEALVRLSFELVKPLGNTTRIRGGSDPGHPIKELCSYCKVGLPLRLILFFLVFLYCGTAAVHVQHFPFSLCMLIYELFGRLRGPAAPPSYDTQTSTPLLEVSPAHCQNDRTAISLVAPICSELGYQRWRSRYS